MKHRTVTVFIVVLAALAIAPQAFQQISTLKASAGSRLNAGIWNAFMSLHGRKVEVAARPQARFTNVVSAPGAEQSASAPRVEANVNETARTREKVVSVAAPRTAERTENRNAVKTVRIETELAKLEQLEGLFAFKAESKERTFVRIPVAPLMALAAAPPAKVVGGPQALVDVSDYGRLIASGLRYAEKEKEHKAGVRAASRQRVSAARSARAEARRQGEFVYRFDPAPLHPGGETRPAATTDNGATH